MKEEYYSNPALGARLREARLKQGMKMHYVEQMAGVSGYICHIERGFVPTAPKLQRLAEVLGLPVDETLLLGGYAPPGLTTEVLDATRSLLRTAPAHVAPALREAAGWERERQLSVATFLSVACYTVRQERRTRRRAS